jgi:MerR family transcriptional regulator/heat shock protein HspR
MNDKKIDVFFNEKTNLALYTISVVAELLGTTDQTLRLYEKHGLIKPARRNRNRYYSENNVKWLRCIRDLIHKKKISIEGIKKLLDYAPCWEMTECPDEKKSACTAFVDRTKSCWELNRMICKKDNNRECEECIVFLGKTAK